MFDYVMEKVFALSTEEGSRQLVYAAVGGSGSPEEEERHKGGYVSFNRVQEPSDFVVSEEGVKLQEKFWVRFLAFAFTYVGG